MGMTIDEAERYLKLMLGGMKYAVSYWKDRDKEESDIEQTNVETVKTALDTMRKYQKIKEIAFPLQFCSTDKLEHEAIMKICEVIEDEAESEDIEAVKDQLPLCEDVIHGDFTGVMDTELKPVIHAKWERGYSFPDGEYWKCSHCNELIKVKIPMHYCNNCGAKMEKEE